MADYRDSAHMRRWWSHIKGDRAYLQERLWWRLHEMDKDWDETHSVRVEFSVCPCCGGKGKHVNPSIDSNGLSQEDFDEDPDFREDYMSGVYDVECAECGGARVVPICLDPDIQAVIDSDLDDEHEYRAEVDAERRMGA